jgi:hypothetical protein
MLKIHLTDFHEHISNLSVKNITNNYRIMPRISATVFKPIQVCFRFFCSEATQLLLRLIVPKICPHIYFFVIEKDVLYKRFIFPLSSAYHHV